MYVQIDRSFGFKAALDRAARMAGESPNGYALIGSDHERPYVVTMDAENLYGPGGKLPTTWYVVDGATRIVAHGFGHRGASFLADALAEHLGIAPAAVRP